MPWFNLFTPTHCDAQTQTDSTGSQKTLMTTADQPMRLDNLNNQLRLQQPTLHAQLDQLQQARLRSAQCSLTGQCDQQLGQQFQLLQAALYPVNNQPNELRQTVQLIESTQFKLIPLLLNQQLQPEAANLIHNKAAQLLQLKIKLMLRCEEAHQSQPLAAEPPPSLAGINCPA